MRSIFLVAAVLVPLAGANCAELPLLDWLIPGDQSPAPARCHSGTFMCADGPILTECGTWSFDVNQNDAITGSGEVDTGQSPTPVPVMLTGIVDPDVLSVQVILVTETGGNGTMNLQYDGPTLSLVGDWELTDGAEPSGTEVSGEATGESCASLW
jgi:hypothetical protein